MYTFFRRNYKIPADGVTAGAVRCSAWLGDVGVVSVIQAAVSFLVISLRLHLAIRGSATPRQQMVYGLLVQFLRNAPDLAVAVQEQVSTACSTTVSLPLAMRKQGRACPRRHSTPRAQSQSLGLPNSVVVALLPNSAFRSFLGGLIEAGRNWSPATDQSPRYPSISGEAHPQS